MSRTNSRIVPPFDFSAAEALSLCDRISTSIETARRFLQDSGYQEVCEFPCIPGGASEDELAKFETELGIPLPREYRTFLERHRYLKLSDGAEIGGLDYEGVHVTEIPRVSDEHWNGVPCLVFAGYWQYADGDQLLIDLTDESHPVVAYLHEHGPLFEFYAPSFSLALWRLVHEQHL